MKIKKINIFTMKIPFNQEVSISKGTRSAATNMFVKIVSDIGFCGWGEGSPYPSLTGETLEGSLAAGKIFAARLVGREVGEIDAHTGDFRNLLRGSNSALAAFDIALYDLLAQRAQLPLFRLLGGRPRELKTDFTIGILRSVEETRAEAEVAIKRGFETVKLKTGRRNDEDIDHVHAVRQVIGPSGRLRIDSNQGWDLPLANRLLEKMQASDPEFCEQPLPHWDIEGMSQLRRLSKIPIAADESVFDSHDAFNVIRRAAADVINIKLGKSGGIHEAIKIEAIASASNVTCMVGCFGETRLGLTAAAHLAMARPNIRHLDLDSSLIHSIDPVLGGMQYDNTSGGKLLLPEDPGLGAAVNEERLGPPLHVECAP